MDDNKQVGKNEKGNSVGRYRRSSFGRSLGRSAATLQDVKAKGFVTCGVSAGIPGFSNPDDKGEWSGIDVDYCRGIATAVSGDPSKAKFVALSSKDRFPALQSGEVDVLTRNTTWTISRDTSLGFNFRTVSTTTARASSPRRAST